MSKTNLQTNIDALVPSGSWPGHVNNSDLNNVLDQLADFRGANVVSVSAAHTADLTTEGVILADASAAAFSVTLPAAADASGRIVTIKKTDSSVNAVTVDGNGAETIDGAATASLGSQYASVTVVSNGTAWFKL